MHRHSLSTADRQRIKKVLYMINTDPQSHVRLGFLNNNCNHLIAIILIVIYTINTKGQDGDSMKNAAKDEINCFLKQYRKQMHKPKNFTIVQRKFNFTELGLTLDQAKSEIRKLKYTDYYEGPSLDHNGDGTEVWVFGKLIEGVMVYIKLKIAQDGFCKCISFKRAERPMRLPYRDE